MTKITNELLEDYAMQYWNTGCMYLVRHPIVVKPKEFFTKINDWSRLYYIQLRSIGSITDEEEMQIYLLEGAGCKFYSDIESLEFKTIDYLRSIGIATPFRGITVNELVESGKLKLI